MALTDRQQAAKDEFIRVRGTWGDSWEAIVQLDPDFLTAYARFSGVPFTKNHLDAKTKEFIFITVDAAATHLYTPGIRQHVRKALEVGATPQEIMEVLELTSTLGIHALNVGVPVLVDVMAELGLRNGPAPLTDYQERLKAEFTATRGYWHDTWNELLELDPEVFEAYIEFSGLPWKQGTLSPKVKEFIYIAFDVSATHLYEKGLRLHMVNAIGYGATPQEILEVMEIASVIGVHAAATAAPILLEEMSKGLVEETAKGEPA
jgi:alkylhydroperoxidase/carboxymuconolactone decarboxylase family protein YurZ